MIPKLRNIVFIGSGAIATSLGNVLALKDDLAITLLSIEDEVVDSINNKNVNQKYFPNLKLNQGLKATTDKDILKDAEIVFLAIPSVETVRYIKEHVSLIKPDTILVNLAKGFGTDNRTIAENLTDILPNPISSFKGPTFARDIINNLPSAFTLASNNPGLFERIDPLFHDTNIHFDHSTDLVGVEILSILKNIYAIAIGIVDAHFNSANLRFMVLTKAFREMRDILLKFKGQEETMFKYCGYGDFSLTALNDLSRNRTLGLLIGKGFFTNDISDKVILEGKIAVNIFHDEIAHKNSITNYPIISEMYRVFNEDYDISRFVNRVMRS